ncbi:DUF1360 domain-containing protein [Streptomyces sp. NPDC088762]|uniref:DUF1360 domain-containing protein n=1 Tax=Streptomyces sp. NPDC088762 TaxID=3365891 RepID=UPI00382B9F3E
MNSKSTLPAGPSGASAEVTGAPADNTPEPCRRHKPLTGLLQGYGGGEEHKLPGYTGSMVAFGLYTTAWTAVLRRYGRSMPGGLRAGDVALTAVATFRLSRLLSKGVVTSPLRAPFTRFKEAAGPSEVTEESRTESGVRGTVGALVTCPFCVGVWVATTFTGAHLLWPRRVRAVTGLLTVLAGADALQLAYSALQQKAAD